QQGFPGGPVYAITQTPDGYLWLGTEKGLVRFDGLKFRLFNKTDSALLPVGPVIDLMTDSDGVLWIRPESRSLLRYQSGEFRDVAAELDSSHNGITAMYRTSKGQAFFAVRTEGIYTYSGGKFLEAISTATVPSMLIIALAQTSDGMFWIGS